MIGKTFWAKVRRKREELLAERITYAYYTQGSILVRKAGELREAAIALRETTEAAVKAFGGKR